MRHLGVSSAALGEYDVSFYSQPKQTRHSPRGTRFLVVARIDFALKRKYPCNGPTQDSEVAMYKCRVETCECFQCDVNPAWEVNSCRQTCNLTALNELYITVQTASYVKPAYSGDNALSNSTLRGLRLWFYQ